MIFEFLKTFSKLPLFGASSKVNTKSEVDVSGSDKITVDLSTGNFPPCATVTSADGCKKDGGRLFTGKIRMLNLYSVKSL